jgi:hypothetical protein
MPRGPRGEKRPADVIGNAVKVMRIATGEKTEELTACSQPRSPIPRQQFVDVAGRMLGDSGQDPGLRRWATRSLPALRYARLVAVAPLRSARDPPVR